MIKKLLSCLLVGIMITSCPFGKLQLKKEGFFDGVKMTAIGMGSTSTETGYTRSLYLEENYATHYFKNLTENFGHNVQGSCAYVALAMLLSFYDTYWDDSIIPENYDMITMLEENELTLDVESPGIYTEPSTISYGGIQATQYYQNVEQYSNAHFHLKLIQLGKEKFGQYRFASTSSACALYYEQLYELANEYLYTYLGKSEDEISIVTSRNLNMDARDFTISMIKQGTPVFIGTTNEDESMAHAMIAYDYDEENDKIYVHAGWRNDSAGNKFVHNDLETIGLVNIDDAIVFQMNNSHSCSNNFKYSDGYNTLETHCACDLAIHPNRIEINYQNLTYENQTALVTLNDTWGTTPPTNYSACDGLDLSNITARFYSSNELNNKMRFLGWCSDAALTTPITSLGANQTGSVTIYAKWRYDFGRLTRSEMYTIDSKDEFEQRYDLLTINISNTQYAGLLNLGMNYLVLNFEMDVWERYDCFEKIFVYGDGGTNSELSQIELDVEGNNVVPQTNPVTVNFSIVIPIEQLENYTVLYIRYGLRGAFRNEWSNLNFRVESMYVVNTSDTAFPEFYS